MLCKMRDNINPYKTFQLKYLNLYTDSFNKFPLFGKLLLV